MTSHTSAHYFLEGLVDLGIEYIFSNLGTDHVSLIEEFARWDQEGRKRPQVILCPHENVAVHMAGGFAAATGRGQAALVHVDAGTGNATMPMHNLCRGRVPVLLMAGKAPFTSHGEMVGSRDSYVHFVQDPYDIGSLVRQYVKWEYSLPTGLVAKEALRRAQAVMQSEPTGPVYMTLPRETLAEEFEETAVHEYGVGQYGPVLAGGIAPDQAQNIAEQLMTAENPVAIVSYLGRKADSVAALEALAMACGVRVVESNPIYVNIPRNSPCFAGYLPGPVIANADFGLLIDVDVPWIPKDTPDAGRTHWVQIDVDAIKKDFPMWGFPANLRLQADSGTVLRQVLEIVREKANDGFRARVARRIAGWEGKNQERLDRVSAAAEQKGKVGAIAPDYVCAQLNQKLSAEDVIVNEGIRNMGVVLNQIPRTKPCTYVGLGGGGLGFSGGTALGFKLAMPNKRVVQIVGDGGFHFSTPDSVYAVAQEYGLPIFTVVLDNAGWQAVKEATLRVYPEGVAAGTKNFQARLRGERQGLQRRFEDVARAFGAYGEKVDDPDDIPAAIDRCLAALAEGQAAVLNVSITPL